MSPILTTTVRPRPVLGRWVRTIDRTGPFPAVVDPRWTPGQAARWRAARDVAAAHVPTTPGGWSEQTLGWRPGARTMLACWAAAPVAGIGTVQAIVTAGLPPALAGYAGAAAGVCLIARGARTLHRAGAGEHAVGERTVDVQVDLHVVHQGTGEVAVLAAASMAAASMAAPRPRGRWTRWA